MSVIRFTVNGVEHEVGSDISSDVMLVDYLRNHLELRGTKYMCREGGCGACIVTAAKNAGGQQVAINSCLTAVGSCHGWDITTIEGLGNRKDGYHSLQKTFAENNATQCGYCTPGWMMMMHGLMECNSEMTMLEIEKSTSSNLCRCTGYRPIIESLRKFAKDAPTDKKVKNLNLCKKMKKCCQISRNENDWCMIEEGDLHADEILKIVLKDGKIWYRPRNLEDVFTLMTEHSESYMLVGGNTAKGVSPISEYPGAMIDVHHLEELKCHETDQNLIVGAGWTITEFMNILKAESVNENFSYLAKVYEHIELVAHIPIRNVATVAGNLMIKHVKNVFQSDMYLLLDTFGAQLTIVDCNNERETVTMANFLKLDMKRKVILNVMLPPLSSSYKYYTYKLMPRAQSAHAIVNLGFLCKLDSSDVVEEARIRYGALSVKFDSAVATESYLVGRSLFTNDTLQGALKVLDGEMVVEDHPPEPSCEYRRFIAKALLFKALISLAPSCATRYSSATVNMRLERPITSSQQTFDTDSTLWPLNQPVHKLEAMIQCAGEAKYTEDIPALPNEVFAAFVLSTVARGTIVNIDASEALALKGVVGFFTAADIPGLNSFTPADGGFTTANEEVLCSGSVKFYNQPIGIIVAETYHIANRAATLVSVTYNSTSTPVVDINEARKDSTRNTLYLEVPATATGTDVYKTITGTNIMKGQYHFPMETMVTIAQPSEEGLDVHVATQWLDGPHTMISRALNIEQNKIVVHCNRVGGSYGLKITRCNQGAVACSLVAYKLNRPCRLIQPLTTNLKAFGKRMPNVSDYEVAVNNAGVIQYINLDSYTDNGYMINEPVVVYSYDTYFNCYDVSKFTYKTYNTVTDTPKNSFCRAPGTLEGISTMETIIERISYELSLSPIDVRLANLDTTNYGDFVNYMEAFKTSIDYVTRRAAVDSYNTENRWTKRGLRISLSRWPPVGSMYDDVNISIYHSDATCIITHGGIEMGQGLNTKVAQAASYLLNIPMSYIQIKSCNTVTNPNAYCTGGSVSTESIIVALRRAAEELNTRLEAVKATLTDPTWPELVTAAYSANVDLQIHGFVNFSDAQTYTVYGLACCEVEVDVLTGEFEILRVDLLQDVGQSISPEIDIGQAEGAFMMGVGYWTCEKVCYDEECGDILTDRSWDYHLPQARDIPQDFRVKFIKSYSNDTILGAKGIGEAPICLSIVVPFAIREAIVEARRDCGLATNQWFDIDGPYSTEKICMAMKTCTDEFKFS